MSLVFYCTDNLSAQFNSHNTTHFFQRLKNLNLSVMICQSASELNGTNKQDHKYVSWQRIFPGTWRVGSWLRFAFCKIQEQDKASSPTPHSLGFFGGRILGFVMPFKTVNLSLIIKSMEIWEESWAFSRDYLLLWNKAGFEKQFSQAPESWLICHFSTETNERRSNASKHCPFKGSSKTKQSRTQSPRFTSHRKYARDFKIK